MRKFNENCLDIGDLHGWISFNALLPNFGVADRTTMIEPIEGFSTGRAPAVGFLFFNPGIDAAVDYFPEILDDSRMMRYPIDDMDVSEPFQPFTGKISTLETPGDPVG